MYTGANRLHFSVKNLQITSTLGQARMKTSRFEKRLLRMPSAVRTEEFVVVISLHQGEEAAGNNLEWLRSRPALGCSGPVTRGTSRHPLRSARNQQQTCVIAPLALAMPRDAPSERKQQPGATMIVPLALLRRVRRRRRTPCQAQCVRSRRWCFPAARADQPTANTRAKMIVPLALLRRAPPQGATHSVDNNKKRTRAQLCNTMLLHSIAMLSTHQDWLCLYQGCSSNSSNHSSDTSV